MKEITVQELKQMLDKGADFQLIDVREEYEFDSANLSGLLIPMGSIIDNVDQISREKMVVLHCKSGGRSGTAVKYLQENFGFDNLYNLKGGILAWKNEIDQTLNVL